MISGDELADEHPELRLMTGYDGCILGIEDAWGDSPKVIYSFDRVIARNMEDGMSRDDAVEYWEFNQAGCNMPEWVFVDEVEGIGLPESLPRRSQYLSDIAEDNNEWVTRI